MHVQAGAGCWAQQDDGGGCSAGWGAQQDDGGMPCFERPDLTDSFCSWANGGCRLMMASLRRNKSLESLGRRRKMEMSLTW